MKQRVHLFSIIQCFGVNLVSYTAIGCMIVKCALIFLAIFWCVDQEKWLRKVTLVIREASVLQIQLGLIFFKFNDI